MTKNNLKYFGTDGIRNKVGHGLIDPEQLVKLGWAAGKMIKSNGGSKVILGKDTRISGYMFESSLEAGFISAGIDVILLGPLPTPAISYLTTSVGADMGVVISASHNPFYDNGIKFFDAKGFKIDEETALIIEKFFEQPLVVIDSHNLGKAERLQDAASRYIEKCKTTYKGESLKNLKIVIDCANGATYQVAPKVFQELGANLITTFAEPNGVNINEGCGATDVASLSKRVLRESANLGIAFDGDGDRLIMVDEFGATLDGDDVLYILATHTNQESVVGSVMSNIGLEEALNTQDIKFHRSLVGDKNILTLLLKHNLIIGAEPSGHVLILDRSNAGDAIIAALAILEVMSDKGVNSLQDLLKDYKKSPSVLINVTLKDFVSAADVENNMEVQQELKALISSFDQKGLRCLIRPSGTEAKIRIMVEAKDKNLAQEYAKIIQEVVQKYYS